MLLLFFVTITTKHSTIETSILKLLPSDKYDLEQSEAINRFTDNVSSKVVFLIGASKLEDAQNAAKLFYGQLSATTLFKDLTLYVDQAIQKKTISQLYPFRTGLLTSKQVSKFSEEDYSSIWSEALRMLSGPITASFSSQLPKDPLLLFADFAQQLAHTDGQIINGMVVVKDHDYFYILINATLDINPFSISQQEQFQSETELAIDLLNVSYSNLRLVRGGVIFHALSGTERARHDISTIGIGSLIGILLLIVITFRSITPIVLSMICIVSGVLVGASSCILLFGTVHIITLVFGSSLIGVSIDYAFHYFAHLRQSSEQNTLAVIKDIFPGITFGLITSVIGYFMLILTDFPGLRQISVFSVTGLVASWLCVILWFPNVRISLHTSTKTPLVIISQILISIWDQRWFRIAIAGLLILLAPLILFTLSDIPFNDDIRILQNASVFQQQQDKTLREILNISTDQQYLLIKANSPQNLLVQEEDILPQLDKLVNSGNLSGYQASSRLFPSLKAQRQSRHLLSNALTENSFLAQKLIDLGLEPDQIESYRDLLTEDNPYLDISKLHNFEIGNLVHSLWLGHIANNYYSVILLDGLKSKNPIISLANSSDNISIISRADDISKLFKQYRVSSMYLIAIAYLVIFALLLKRYRLLKSLLVILPPIFASFLAIAISVWTYTSLNIFHIFAVILVLAIGIDYTIFFAESMSPRKTTMLAITLSAITTILSFGLLALSDTTAISSFGLTIMCGILVSFLLSPIVSTRHRNH